MKKTVSVCMTAVMALSLLAGGAAIALTAGGVFVFQKIKKWKSIFSVLQTNPRGFFFSTMIAFFITALYGTSQKIFVFLRRANLFLEA